MRVAVCFYGLVGSKANKSGLGVPLDPKIAHDLYENNIFKHNDVDIFIHSWSIDHKEELNEIYKPKKSIIEQQKEFNNTDYLISNIDLKLKVKEYITKIYNRKSYYETINNRKKEAFRSHSRWYSCMKSIQLKKRHEVENNFKYDCVLLTRLDVGFYTPLILSEYDQNKFYASHWNDYPNIENDFIENFKNHNKGIGFLDFWFFSNSSNMDKFGELFQRINFYGVCPHRASYEHAKFCNFDIEYTKYRWRDFEMIRRKEYSSNI